MNRKNIMFLVVMIIAFGLFSLCACEDSSTSLDVPEIHIEIQFEKSDHIDIHTLSSLISIGLTEGDERYIYKLFVYNKKDVLLPEKWHLLKDIGPYSSIYEYTGDNDEIIYNYYEEFNIPESILNDDSGTICFCLIGDIYVNNQSSIQTKRTIEYNFTKENNSVSINIGEEK